VDFADRADLKALDRLLEISQSTIYKFYGYWNPLGLCVLGVLQQREFSFLSVTADQFLPNKKVIVTDSVSMLPLTEIVS